MQSAPGSELAWPLIDMRPCGHLGTRDLELLCASITAPQSHCNDTMPNRRIEARRPFLWRIWAQRIDLNVSELFCTTVHVE